MGLENTVNSKGAPKPTVKQKIYRLAKKLIYPFYAYGTGINEKDIDNFYRRAS